MSPRDLPGHAVLHGPSVSPSKAARSLAVRALGEGGYKAEGLHEYTDATGAPLYWRVRARLPDGSKWIRPMRRIDVGYSLSEPDLGQGASKPIYRLHEIAAADRKAPVWWVEGENCADALGKRGLLATTAGSAQSDDRADFEPLRDRHVIVWPDNDKPGRAHGERVAAKLRALGCTVETIDIAALGLPEHGDVVDYLRAHPGATAADLMALARQSAGPIEPNACPSAPEADAVVVDMVRGDAVRIEPVGWLWRGWLALSKLHILAGAPGGGKTTIALAFAATITSGGRWPDGTRAEPADVVMWSGEDDPADTLAPRLLAMGADLRRVQFVTAARDEYGRRAFDPARDMPALADALLRSRPRLLVLDPIVNAVGGDSHKNGEVRRALAPVVELAAEIGCAVLGISHFSKGTAGRDPVERVTGSLAFGALARIVLAAAKQPEDQGGGRLLARAKSNIGPDGGGYAYSLGVSALQGRPEIEATRVLWGAALEGTARELLGTAEAEPEAGGEGRDAADWLREALADGEVDAQTLRRLTEDAGYAWRSMQRVAHRIGATAVRTGFGAGAKYVWRLPMRATDPPCTPCAPHSECGVHGEHGADGATEPAPDAAADHEVI